MSKQPNIAFPRGEDRVQGVTSNGITFKFVLGRKDDFLEIDADGLAPKVRKALLQARRCRDGEHPWFLRRDVSAVFIPQWDTTTHAYKPSRGGKLGLQCPRG